MERKATEKDLRKHRALRENARNGLATEDILQGINLLPVFNVATSQMVADFYEVELAELRRVIVSNRSELEANGMYTLTRRKFKEIKPVPFKESHRNIEIHLDTDQVITISNRGAVVFSKDTILWVGMLLKDSVLARRLRKRLIKSQDLHVTDEVVNQTVKKTKIPVTAQRQLMRELVTQYCRETKGNIVKVWSAVYQELKTNHGIDVNQRKTNSGKPANTPLVSFLNQDEQLLVIAIIVAMFRIEEKEVPSLIQDLEVKLPELSSFSIEKQLTLEEWSIKKHFDDNHDECVSQGFSSWVELKAWYDARPKRNFESMVTRSEPLDGHDATTREPLI